VKHLKFLLVALLAVAPGCDDDAPASAAADAATDAGAAMDATPLVPDAAPHDAEVIVDARPPAAAVWLEVAVDPRRALYTQADTPALTATVFDRAGTPVDGHAVAWAVIPPAMGRVEAGTLHFMGEGAGEVQACVAEVCASAAFYVDDADPVLVLQSPTRGASYGGDGSATLSVTGTATDSGGDVTVRINGTSVALGDGGAFSLDLPATFGINRVVVTADDGVRNPPVEAVREVMWAPAWTRVEPDHATVVNAISLRLDQSLLDADRAVELPEEGGELGLDGSAQMLGALLALTDVSTLLGDPQIADTPAFSLRIDDITLGAPDIDLYFTADGVELFMRLPALRMRTGGALDLQGEAISLDGTLEVRLSAFAVLGLGLDEGALSVSVGEVGIAVEEVAGAFENPTANVLVETFGSRLGTITRDLASGLVDGLIREQLPSLIEDALDSVLSTLSSIPVNLDTGIEGIPPLELTIGMAPSAVDLRRREMMALHLDATITHPQPVAAPHEDPGVATLSAEAPVLVEGAGLGVSLRLELINVLLHEVWRAGLLQLTPALPDSLTPLVRSVSLDGRLPPVVAPSPPGSVLPLEVQMGDLRVAMVGRLNEAPDVYAVDLRVGVTVEAAEGRFELVVADSPRFKASLVSQAGARAFLTPDQIAVLLEGLVWPQIEEVLANGLAFGIDPIEVDPAALGDIAPRLQGITLVPNFDKRPIIRDGRAELEGGIEVRLNLAPAAGE
jgi:hypothetical protein